MLHDPARHEPLRRIDWDEARVRATIARIVRETVVAFSPETLWPAHPRDLNATDPPGTVFPNLYFGAGGVAWALDYLRRSGVADAPSFAPHLQRMCALNRAWLAEESDEGDEGVGNAGSYLMGDLPFEMMAFGHAPDAARADRIAALIDGNIDHPARELMWGSPGSLLAAALMHRHTGDARWAASFRRIARRLREQLSWSERQACHFWEQDLYGRRVRYIDAVHGFVATARALLMGRDLLDDAQDWQRIIETTVANTALREDGRATWPVQADEPPGTPQKWLMQFCHGAPGFVICLADLPGTALDALLCEAGEATWAAGPLAKGSNLCHGTAGNAYAFLVLHARTGDARWRERALAFAMHAIAQFEDETAATGRLRHSLWTGDIGLAIFLWDCVRGVARFPTLDVFFAG